MSGTGPGGTAPAASPPDISRAPSGLHAVLFDMDGLLVDSEPLWFETERAVMARLGSGWTAADQEYLIGGSLRHSVGYMLGKAARPVEPEVLAEWLTGGMRELIMQRGLPLKPGAVELLAEVALAGIPSALVTSAERPIMEATLQVTGIAFTVTICGDDVTRAKPDPEPYRRAAELLGAEPGRCVALDDSPAGVASAEAAGCAVIAVPSVPIPPGQRRLTVTSLAELNLARLRELAAG